MKRFIKKYKSEIIVGASALCAGILSFFLTLNINQNIKENNLKENEIDIAISSSKNEINEKFKSKTLDINVEKLKEDIKEFESLADVIDANNENINLKPEENITVTNTKKDEVINKEQQNYTQERTIESSVIVAVSENLERKKELCFDLPVSGDIVLDYAKDKLVYSETLDEWITHDGVDIKATEGVPVKVSESGVITGIKMDPRYGNLIVVKHDDEYQTLYSNINTIDNVYVGKEIKKGEIIATVAEGFGFESKEGAHVHFEIIKNGNNVNPIKVKE